MIETFLWRFVEHRKRRAIVISVTSAILLLLVLPAVDNYNAARGRLKNLHDEFANTKALVDQSAKYQALVKERETKLAALSQHSFSPNTVEQFRGELVNLVRDLGCQMRRLRVGDAILQTDLAAAIKDPKNAKDARSTARFEIYGQTLSLQVTGPIHRIKELVKWVHSHEGMLQAQLFSLKKSDENPELSNLDLDLILLDLRTPKEKSS